METDTNNIEEGKKITVVVKIEINQSF